MLSEGQIQGAVDTLWRYIEADRYDPQTWVDAGPRSPDCWDHPTIRATDLFALCRELAGDLSDDAEFFRSHSLLSLNMHHPCGIVERDMGRIFNLIQ